MLPISNIYLLLLSGNNNDVMKTRELTEKRILDAVAEIVGDEGFEALGVNVIAQRAGVSKMLIYRYFGSLDGLVTRFVLERDYWVNVGSEPMEGTNVASFLKALFRRQISLLREDIVLRRLHRWELSTEKALVDNLRERREVNGRRLIDMVSRLTDVSRSEVAAMATILSASISYLVLLEERTPTYNDISLRSDEGWEQIAKGMDSLIDLWVLANK